MSYLTGSCNFAKRKIVILESETVQHPPPKSILKKRSLENLLDVDPILPPVVSNNYHAQDARQQQQQPRINVTITNQTKEPPTPLPTFPSPPLGDQPQEVLPWRIHLKHVEPPLKAKLVLI